MIYDINFNGIHKLIGKLNAATRPDVIKDGLMKGGLYLAGWSAKNRFLDGGRKGVVHPTILTVRTNRLRSNMLLETAQSQVEKHGNEYIKKIGTNVKYGRFHEYGTRIMKPRPFLTPAIENTENQHFVHDVLRQRIIDAINES